MKFDLAADHALTTANRMRRGDSFGLIFRNYTDRPCRTLDALIPSSEAFLEREEGIKNH